jgi:hypothetical protein
MRDTKTTNIPPADALILLASMAGIGISLVLAAWGICVAPSPLQGIFEGIGAVALVGTLPVGAAFVFRQQALGAEGPPDYSGCPRWMRVSCNALMISGVVLFFLPAAMQFCGIGPAFDGSQLPSTLPGGFGLAAYTGIFGQTYSSVSLRERTPSGSPPVA